MYLDFYQLSERPFNLTPDPKFFFASESHRAALDLLLYAIEQREGFVVLTGDVGSGKTMLCRTLLERLDDKSTLSALVLNPFLSEEDLLKTMLQDFGVLSPGPLAAANGPPRPSKQDLIELLNRFLLNLVPVGGRAILIIDEAQNLPPATLEQIRILSNLETDKEKLLQIVLLGQLELGELLKSPRLKQLNQRISVRYQLRPLEKEEVPKYINHRLMVAGSNGQVQFSGRALNLIYKYSRGVPRLINLICDRALVGGFALQTRKISAAIVKKAVDGLELEKSGMIVIERKPFKLMLALVFTLFLLALAALAWTVLSG